MTPDADSGRSVDSSERWEGGIGRPEDALKDSPSETFECECGGDVWLTDDLAGNSVDIDWLTCEECGQTGSHRIHVEVGEFLEGVVYRD